MGKPTMRFYRRVVLKGKKVKLEHFTTLNNVVIDLKY